MSAHTDVRSFLIEPFILSSSKKTGEILCSACQMDFTNIDSFAFHCAETHKAKLLSYFEKYSESCSKTNKTKIINFIIDERQRLEANPENLSTERQESPINLGIHLPPKTKENKKQEKAEIKEDEQPETEQTEKAMSLSLSIDNIINADDEETTLINKELAEMEKLEKLMLATKLIQYDNDEYKCNICSEDNIFSTSIGLVYHCREMHPFALTPTLRQRISMLRNFENPVTEEDMVTLTNELRLDMMLRPTIDAQAIMEKEGFEAEGWLSVPAFFADLLVELFGSERPDDEKFRFPKREWNNDLVWLEIPAKLPFLFLSNGSKTKIGFFETEHLSADNAKQLIKKILNTLTKNFILVATVENVSKTNPFTREKFLELCNDYNVHIFSKKEDSKESERVCSMTIYIYSNSWNDEMQEKIETCFTEMFKEVEMKRCAICKEFYREGDGSECSKAVMGGLVFTRKVTNHRELEEKQSFINFEKKKALSFAK